MNIVQLNQYIEKIARCIQIVHSYTSQSPYEYWNAKGDVQYGSVCFCIKKSRMRSNTITYDAVLYYADRVVDTPSNKEQIWSDANNVIQNIVGTINMQSDGEVTISYPYDITNFEQKFADNLAGAYATLSIDTKGIGECGDLLYGYEEEDKIKLESIVKTITVNGEYDITSSKDYDAISDVKVIVDIPLQEKSIEINSNGHHNVSPDNGYEGLSNVGVIVDIPLQEKSIEINHNGQHNVSPDVGYEGLSNVGVIVNVAPDPKDTFSSIGYNEETAGGFLNLFSNDLEVSKRILDEWNSTGSSTIDISKWKNDTVYFPAVDLTMKSIYMGFDFYNWKKLQVVPSLDFTGRTSAYNLFHSCSSLRCVGNITGTANVTSMYYMFAGCESLTSIPPMDTRNVQNMNSAFYECKSLTSIPQLDTSSVTSMYETFSYCSSLTSIPQMNISKVNNIGYMFNNCSSLTSIPLLDCSSVTSTSSPFGWSALRKLTDLGGFKNLKVSWSSYFLDNVPNATVESLMNVINNLYDLTANGLSGKTLKFGTTNLNKLTDEQKAVATAKGWTLT